MRVTYFMPLVFFYTPRKLQKAPGFLMFSRNVERRPVTWNGLSFSSLTVFDPQNFSIIRNILAGVLLRINDDLNNVFIRYDRYDKNRKAVTGEIKPEEVNLLKLCFHFNSLRFVDFKWKHGLIHSLADPHKVHCKETWVQFFSPHFSLQSTVKNVWFSFVLIYCKWTIENWRISWNFGYLLLKRKS